MQLLSSEKLFKKAAELIVSKWSKLNSNEINDFFKYFQSTYLSERSFGWYEGHALGHPSTSNSIESTHRHIKLDKDLIVKKSLRHFLSCMERGLIYNWSMHYNPHENPNVRSFACKPTIETKDYLKAYDYNQLKRKVIGLDQPDKSIIYFTTASDYVGPFDKHICRALLVQYNDCNFDSFDKLIDLQKNIYMIKINFDQWELSECTCYFWLKNFKCKHVISISSLKKLCSFESVAMNLPLEPKKRRGRRKMRKGALGRDEVEENFLEDDEFQIEEYGLQTIAQVSSPKKTKSKIIITKAPKKITKKTLKSKTSPVIMKTRSSKRLRGNN